MFLKSQLFSMASCNCFQLCCSSCFLFSEVCAQEAVDSVTPIQHNDILISVVRANQIVFPAFWENHPECRTRCCYTEVLLPNLFEGSGQMYTIPDSTNYIIMINYSTLNLRRIHEHVITLTHLQLL